MIGLFMPATTYAPTHLACAVPSALWGLNSVSATGTEYNLFPRASSVRLKPRGRIRCSHAHWSSSKSSVI